MLCTDHLKFTTLSRLTIKDKKKIYLAEIATQLSPVSPSPYFSLPPPPPPPSVSLNLLHPSVSLNLLHKRLTNPWPDTPWLIFIGTCLVSGGGITYFMTNVQISLLFPKAGSLVIGLLVGGFEASTVTAQAVKVSHPVILLHVIVYHKRLMKHRSELLLTNLGDVKTI